MYNIAKGSSLMTRTQGVLSGDGVVGEADEKQLLIDNKVDNGC